MGLLAIDHDGQTREREENIDAQNPVAGLFAVADKAENRLVALLPLGILLYTAVDIELQDRFCLFAIDRRPADEAQSVGITRLDEVGVIVAKLI